MSAPKDPIKNLEWRNKIGAANKGRKSHLLGKHLTEDHRMKLIAAKKGVWSGENNPFFGKKHSKETIEKMRKAHKGQIAWNKGISPPKEIRDQISETLKKRCSDPEIRKQLKEQATGVFPTEETRLRLIESHLVGGLWFGNVRDDEPKYCELWTEEFRNRVRAYYGYICVECNTPQNGRKHSVHHVHYDKKTCCKEGEEVRERRFVVLCRSCHMKSNHNRLYWEQHFTDIVDNYYEGKCYFTRDEFNMLYGGVPS
jgi:hypothetical protein